MIIHELEVLAFTGTTARLAVRCSKGTYIRSLVTDIGEAIGCGAHVTALRRTFVSPFDASFNMTELAALEQIVESAGGDSEAAIAELDSLLLPLDAGLAHLPAVSIDEAGEASFQRGQSAICRNGAPAHAEGAIDGNFPCRVYDAAGRLVGLGELTGSGEQVAPRRVLQWD